MIMHVFLFVEHFMNEIFQLFAMKKNHIQFPYAQNSKLKLLTTTTPEEAATLTVVKKRKMNLEEVTNLLLH